MTQQRSSCTSITITNPGSVGKTLPLSVHREALAQSWDRLGKAAKVDHLNLNARRIAAEIRAGLHDPLPLIPRAFDFRTERFLEVTP